MTSPGSTPDLRAKLDDMQLHDDTGDPCDEGYMAAVNELRTWLDSQGGDAHDRGTERATAESVCEAIPSSDVARAGDAEDRVPGQPDPEVERLRVALLNQRWGDLGVQVQRAERAEDRLRAWEDFLKGDAHHHMQTVAGRIRLHKSDEPDLLALAEELSECCTRLRAVLSEEHP